MTIFAAPPDVNASDGAVTPRDLIGQVRDARRRREQAERDVLILGLAWAVAHEVPGPVTGGGDFPDTPVDDAAASDAFDVEQSEGHREWRGLPVLAWDAAAPFAAALGLSTRGGRTVLRRTLTLAHRLPRTNARWHAGGTDTRTATKVADAVTGQPDDVAAWVDHQVDRRLGEHRVIGPVVLDRLIAEAMTELHAEELELERQEQLQARYARIVGDPENPHGASGPDVTGLVEFVIRGDWPDVKAFSDTIAALAEAIRHSERPDSCEPLDVRRSIAVGIIADPSAASALLNPDTDKSASRDRKQNLLLTFHLAPDAIRGIASAPIGVDADQRPWLTSMVAEWAGRDDLTLAVRPLVHCGGCSECDTICDSHADPDSNHHYRPTGTDKALVALRDPRCVFPYCAMPARRTDCDHVIPFDPKNSTGTPTCPRCNLAPLCRHHHRLKTHAGWTYQHLEPGSYRWSEPHGQRFLTTRWGTTDATDPP